jgi:hypothetical protein
VLAVVLDEDEALSVELLVDESLLALEPLSLELDEVLAFSEEVEPAERFEPLRLSVL